MSDSSHRALTGRRAFARSAPQPGQRVPARGAPRAGIEGLLPPVADTLETQIARVHAQLAVLDSDLQKYLFLSDLQSRNEMLFYAVLMSDPATFMPLVYTPTVGEACQKFDHIFRASRGLYLPITAQGAAARIARQLAAAGCPLHRRDRRRAHPRPRRSRRRRHGHPGRQAGALHRLRRRAAATDPADHARRRHQQRELLDDPLYLGLRQNRGARRRVRRLHRRVRAGGAGALPEMLPAMGGLRQHQRRADPGALPRQDLHLQRRHPGHRRGGARRHPRRRCGSPSRNSPSSASCSSAAARPPPASPN